MALVFVCGAACASGRGGSSAAVARPAATIGDTAGLIPAQFGSLRQDDIALRLQVRGTLIKAIPLDEGIIRTLSPDSYATLHDLRLSKAGAIRVLADRRGVRGHNVWYVSYYGMEPEARFDPYALAVTSAGLDYRPLELLPLSAGFGEHRVHQRESQSALVLFDDALDMTQPATLSIDAERNDAWAGILRTIELERALIRSRAARGPTR
ncbi:MAG: hypothetical protein NVS4B3_14810 [Gemmatimonadaceae bacterium]